MGPERAETVECMLPKPTPRGLGEDIILTKILSRAGMFAGICWAGEEASNDKLSESEPVRIPVVRIALMLLSLPGLDVALRKLLFYSLRYLSQSIR